MLGDSIAEGVREPLAGFRDLSWVDRIAASLRPRPPAASSTSAAATCSRAEVRASQLDAALAFRPDLAIVAAGGNDALRRSFDPSASSASSTSWSARCGARAPTW